MFWPRSGFTPTPRLAEIAGRHGEVGDAHDRGRALSMLGDAEAVIDRGVAAPRIETGGGANVLCLHAGHGFERLGAVAVERHEVGPGRNSSQSQRWRTEDLSTRPSFTITCASAVTIATLVPGFSAR